MSRANNLKKSVLLLYPLVHIYDELAGIHSLTLFFVLKMLNSNLDMLPVEHNHACEDVQMLKELNFLNKEREELLMRIRELDTRSELSNDFQVSTKCIICRRKLYLKWVDNNYPLQLRNYYQFVRICGYLMDWYLYFFGRILKTNFFLWQRKGINWWFR